MSDPRDSSAPLGRKAVHLSVDAALLREGRAFADTLRSF